MVTMAVAKNHFHGESLDTTSHCELEMSFKSIIVTAEGPSGPITGPLSFKTI